MYKCKKKSIILKRGKKVPACLLASPNDRSNTDRQTQHSAAASHTRTQTQVQDVDRRGQLAPRLLCELPASVTHAHAALRGRGSQRADFR